MSEHPLWSESGPRDPDFLDAPRAVLDLDGFDPSSGETYDEGEDEFDDDEEFLHG